jgi:hypothetical protein
LCCGIICGAEKASQSAPWSITNYYTKKRERNTGSLGELLETDDSVAEPVGWNKRKLELKCKVISDMEACHLDEQALLKRCEVLAKVVPDLESSMETMKANVLCKLLLNVSDVSMRMLSLKTHLPFCNASKLVARNLFLLLEDWDEVVEENIKGVKAILEEAEFTNEEAKRLLDQSPEMIDCEIFTQVWKQLPLFFPNKRPKSVLLSNPDIALGMQNLEHQARGNYEL